MLKKTFPKRLSEARKSSGLSQGELAKKIGSTQVWVCHVERGRRLPALPGLLKLAKALNVTTDFLTNHTVKNNNKKKGKK